MTQQDAACVPHPVSEVSKANERRNERNDGQNRGGIGNATQILPDGRTNQDEAALIGKTEKDENTLKCHGVCSGLTARLRQVEPMT